MYNRIYNFALPSTPLEPFRCGTEHGEKIIPTSFVRVTKSKPPIIFSTNFESNRESYLSRKQLFQMISKERVEIIKKLIDNPSKAQPSSKRNRSQPWYHKSWKKAGEPECKVLEKSVGLSFLQNYSDEEEENEAEEIVICSSIIDKKNEHTDSATAITEENEKPEDLVDNKNTLPTSNIRTKKKDHSGSASAITCNNEKAQESFENDTEEIVFKNKDHTDSVKETIKKDEIINELVDSSKKASPNEEERKKDKCDWEITAHLKSNVDNRDEERLTPVRLNCDYQISKTTDGDDEKIFSSEVETNELEERLTPSNLNLKLELNKRKEHHLERVDSTEYKKNRALEVDDTDRLTPKQICCNNETVEYNQDRLTPEEISHHDNQKIDKFSKNKYKDRLTPEELSRDGKSEIDEISMTKNVIKELEKELEKRKNLKEDRAKAKKKKAGVKRRRESSDIEDESPKSKKRKKKNKQKRKFPQMRKTVQALKDKKKKYKRYKKRKSEKSKKKKNKYKKDKSRRLKNKKKKESSEERSMNEKSAKKKKEAIADLSVLEEPKKKSKKKTRTRSVMNYQSVKELVSKENKKDKERGAHDQVPKTEEKKKYDDWEEEELLRRTFLTLERERSERMNSKLTNLGLVESLENKLEKTGIEQMVGKSKERKRHSRESYITMMSVVEAEVLQNQDVNISRERNDYLDGRGKERKSSREKTDVVSGFPSKQNKFIDKRYKDEKRKSKKIEDVRPPLFIKQEPEWIEDNDTKRIDEDASITDKLEQFPLAKDTMEVAKDLGTPDTDEYRGNWEKDSSPVWESDDEGVTKTKEDINTSWESDEEVHEEVRVVDKPLNFAEGLDLEIPLNIKPFKRREIIDADKELQVLKIQSQSLNEERIQLELDKIKIKQLELANIEEVECKEKESPPKRKRSKEETIDVVENKTKRRRWDKKEADSVVHHDRKSPEVVAIDLSESTSSVNTSAVLENEYEEFIKAVTSKPRNEDLRKLNESIISLSSFSDFSDSNCSFDNRHLIDVKSMKMSTPIKSDKIGEASTSQIIIAPKDIPFIPMPGEVKVMPGEVKLLPGEVKSIPAEVKPIPGEEKLIPREVMLMPEEVKPMLGEVKHMPGEVKHMPGEVKHMPGEVKLMSGEVNSMSGEVKPMSGEVKLMLGEVKPTPVPAPPIDIKTISNLSLPSENLASIIEVSIGIPLDLKPVTPLLVDPEPKAEDSVVSSSVFDNSVKEMNEIGSTEISAEVTSAAPLKEEPISLVAQEAPEKPFSFTSLILPSKKLLINNSKLNLGDSDDESNKMRAIDEIRLEKSISSGKSRKLPEEELKEENALEIKSRVKQDIAQEVKQDPPREVKPDVARDVKPNAAREAKQGVSKLEDGKRRRSRSRSPKSGAHHGRERAERKASSPRRGSDSSYSSRNRRRESSPRRRGWSPRRHSSPARSPVRRKSSPGSRRRYSSRRSNSPSHRRRSPSPRRKSPKRSTSPRTSSSKSSRRGRSRSPQKPVKFHQMSERSSLEAHTSEPPAVIASPLEELKRSVADSTISDDSLLPQPNLEEMTESPLSHFYGRAKTDMSRQLSMNEGVRQILGYAKEDLRPISTTYDNYRYEQNQLSQILETIGQFSRSAKIEAGIPSKSEVFHNKITPVDIEVPASKALQSMPQSQNSFVQVGNMVQIVPSDLNVKTEAVQAAVTDRKLGNEKQLHQQENKTRIVQVGNMLQIVPNDSPPEVIPPPLPAKPKEEQIENVKAVIKVVNEQEKRSAEMAMQQKLAEKRAEREKRRIEREARRKEKEKRRREKEKQRQVKMKQKTENMIKRALQLEVAGEVDPLLNETPTQWPPLPSISSTSKDGNKSILVLGHRKSVKLDRRKTVKFADGVRPGEGTSPSAGEELSSSPRYRKLPKEKRYTKTKLKMKEKKKKIKVKIIKPPTETEESDEEDILPPPSPPPGSPPPHVFPPRLKTHPVNNVHPYVANLIPAQQASQSPVLYRPPLNVLLPPLPSAHHHLPPPLPLPMPPHHMSGRPPEPPMMHHGPPPPGMPQMHVPPPPPQAVQTTGSSHRNVYHY
ncbi:LOW QUALITY PROTEIN: uncharacterized protein [Leptinotarsa decemlineata]|uniref:LOW QUALITY PROTEIN: uncharacterized protein n=1 Tax=Leptinotarsa decemlineata TaxID=7539 RepID=UPI003D3097F9